MATYATVGQLRDYADLVGGADPDLETVLARAERDVEAVEPGDSLDTATGLSYDPANMEAWKTQALSRAVCAQAEYRISRGEPALVDAQYDRVSGPDFTTEGLLPHIGPKVWRELAAGGLLRRHDLHGYQAASVSLGPPSLNPYPYT